VPVYAVIHVLSSETFWYDSRLRCDIADVYFELYGRKKPAALPLAELDVLRPTQVTGAAAAVSTKQSASEDRKAKGEKQKSFTIPKAEKKRAAEPEPQPEQKVPKIEQPKVVVDRRHH